MDVVLKYVGFGLMLVFLGVIGVGVLLYYLVRRLFEPDEPDEPMDDGTDGWG